MCLTVLELISCDIKAGNYHKIRVFLVICSLFYCEYNLKNMDSLVCIWSCLSAVLHRLVQIRWDNRGRETRTLLFCFLCLYGQSTLVFRKFCLHLFSSQLSCTLHKFQFRIFSSFHGYCRTLKGKC